jgi:hypothetical protein
LLKYHAIGTRHPKLAKAHDKDVKYHGYGAKSSRKRPFYYEHSDTKMNVSWKQEFKSIVLLCRKDC